MSGGHQAAAGVSAANYTSYSATVAASGGGFAYINGSVGSIAPIGTFKGNTIARLQSDSTVHFQIRIAPAGLAQSFFSRMLVQRTSGAWSVMPSASAIFTSDDGAGATLWEFTVLVTPQVWTSAGSYGVLIIP